MRGDSRLFGAAVALVGLAVLLTSAVAPATAGSKKKGPKIAYAEFTENPENGEEYRFKVGAIRTSSVVLELKESPQEGQTTGPTETIQFAKNPGTTSPVVWTATTPKTRSAPCYRAAYIAKNSKGRVSKTYRLCIFAHENGARAVRVTRW